MVPVPWGLSSQLPRFQRPPSEAEREGGPRFSLCGQVMAFPPLVSEKNKIKCFCILAAGSGQKWSESLRKAGAPYFAHCDGNGFISTSTRHSSAAMALHLPLNHSHPCLINCWLSCSRGFQSLKDTLLRNTSHPLPCESYTARWEEMGEPCLHPTRQGSRFTEQDAKHWPQHRLGQHFLLIHNVIRNLNQILVFDRAFLTVPAAITVITLSWGSFRVQFYRETIIFDYSVGCFFKHPCLTVLWKIHHSISELFS